MSIFRRRKMGTPLSGVLNILGMTVAFAALYSLVYRATSNAYYNIVSGAKERVA